MSAIALHPFREGIMRIISKHCSPQLSKRFILSFESEVYNKDYDESLWKAVKDGNMILECRYTKSNGLTEYICDFLITDSPAKCEAKFLRYVTDKVKAGAMGEDWIFFQEKFDVSHDISSGKHETKSEPTHNN